MNEYEAGNMTVQIDIKSSFYTKPVESITFDVEVIEGDCNIEETAGLTADPPICTPLPSVCDGAVLAFNEQQLEQFATEYFAQVKTTLDVSI